MKFIILEIFLIFKKNIRIYGEYSSKRVGIPFYLIGEKCLF